MGNDRGFGMGRSQGFTLLELMIVVAIIAILSAIAIPTYGRYAFRAHRVDGQELLLRVANAQERFYATNNVYGGMTDIGYTDPMSEKGYYSVSIDVPAASSSQSFTATATPQGGQAQDDCGNLTITNAGVKASSGTTTNGSCW
ncbi:type IV pilin protein [Rhodanobacter sp. Col0626]|uniref:type IV pilin protein n=1 Tax=Rhodanobacter sp. Col0626 TaxID=3415679 RepID=UPI003CEC057D